MNTNNKIQIQFKILLSTLFKFLINENKNIYHCENVTLESWISPGDIKDQIKDYNEGYRHIAFINENNVPKFYLDGELLFAPSKLQLHIASIVDCFVKEQPFDIPKLLGRV